MSSGVWGLNSLMIVNPNLYHLRIVIHPLSIDFMCKKNMNCERHVCLRLNFLLLSTKVIITYKKTIKILHLLYNHL